MTRFTPQWSEFDDRPPAASRAGLSLLEVLIACGILALGLSGIAAMIPAAGLRFGEATTADRARFLAGNGHAEMLNRGLTTAAAVGSGRCAMFGQVATAAGGLHASLVAGATSGLDGRAFITEDELVYDESAPVNVFTANGVGPRAYRDTLVWGATLIPASLPAQPGGSAVLTVAVFRRPGAAKLITLTGNDDGSWQCGEADRLQFLRACSAVLVVQSGGTPVRPEWLQVRASWPGSVVLAADAAGASATLQVIGFENVERVEHHAVTLQ